MHRKVWVVRHWLDLPWFTSDGIHITVWCKRHKFISLNNLRFTVFGIEEIAISDVYCLERIKNFIFFLEHTFSGNSFQLKETCRWQIMGNKISGKLEWTVIVFLFDFITEYFLGRLTTDMYSLFSFRAVSLIHKSIKVLGEHKARPVHRGLGHGIKRYRLQWPYTVH